MPAQKRYKTKYPGVYYIKGKSIGTNKPERIYYVMYRKNGKQIQEKAGRQFQDDMTAARAAQIRARRITGDELSNKERRGLEIEQKNAEAAKWTVNRLWEEYRIHRSQNKGLRVDTGRYDNYLKAKFGEKEPLEIIQLDVDRLRINLLKKLSPQTVKHILALLKRVINFGVNKGLCEGTPFSIELPRVNNNKTEDLTPDQLSSLLEAIDDDTNIQAANMMKLALFTGMRRGEMFKLKWDDIKFDRGFIDIIDPKGGPDQKIPLNEAAMELLQNHPRTGSEYVFPGRGGRQRTDIKHQVNRIKERAGIAKNFRALHGLRHVYASMLASSGQVDMYTLQKLLTHKSPLMTQRYAHLRDETLKRAANVAGDIINQAVKNTADEKIVNLEKREK
jgi:integrase